MNPNTSESFSAIFNKAERSHIFWEEMAILGFTESVLEQMEILGMSKKDLAEKMNVSQAFVTKMISGRNNFTFKTVVKVARAVGCEFIPQLRQTKEAGQWRCYRTNVPLRSLVFTPLAKEIAEEGVFRPTNISAVHESVPAAA